MPRPKRELTAEDLRRLEILARGMITETEAAEFLGMARGTLRARLRDAGYASYGAFRAAHMAATRVHLRRLQWECAQSGNVAMLIWLGKQWLGQSNAGQVEISATDLDQKRVLAAIRTPSRSTADSDRDF